MIWDRRSAFDTISRVLAILRYDIEHHQSISEYSLNIWGENYFRDVFNFVYDRNFINANTEKVNAEYIDLIDKQKKEIIQITTQRTAAKVKHSLKSLKIEKYKGYKLCVFFILGKPKLSGRVKKGIEDAFKVKLDGILLDPCDLMQDIGDLEENKLCDLAGKYFYPHEESYTDIIVLDLVCKKLIKEQGATLQPHYNDDLFSIDVSKKIKINGINQRMQANIATNLDYTSILESIDEGNLSTNLRLLVVDDFYKNILKGHLKSIYPSDELEGKEVSDLQSMAMDKRLDFNRLIDDLYSKIKGSLRLNNFNSMNISWILVAYFFEICDVGVKENGLAH